MLRHEDLAAFAAVVSGTERFVIVDEIYAELTYGERHVPSVFLPAMRDRTVLIVGVSKACAMTGWRLGYAAAPAYIFSGSCLQFISTPFSARPLRPK